jgi:hypothetical protein
MATAAFLTTSLHSSDSVMAPDHVAVDVAVLAATTVGLVTSGSAEPPDETDQAAHQAYEQGRHGAFAAQCDLIRDVFGNPFRPVAVHYGWITATVVRLARGIYEGGAFDRLPILADALEEAGCDNAAVLAHCRGEGPHVRGCWVLDLLLGKSCS